jgi:hypothetical protein
VALLAEQVPRHSIRSLTLLKPAQEEEVQTSKRLQEREFPTEGRKGLQD